MNYKLHIASRMFLTDPYVVRVRHPESVSYDNQNLSEFRKMLKIAKAQITDTWGYSNPVFEIIKTDGEPGVIFTGITTTQWFTPTTECHSYWVFTNELDALQFRLSVGENALQMHMWPNNVKFTITEYIEDTDII
jgi:hypothetical protein